jgi:hypothetical protein
MVVISQLFLQPAKAILRRSSQLVKKAAEQPKRLIGGDV